MIFKTFLLIIFIQSISFGECFRDVLPNKLFNTQLENQNPWSNWPPKTDEGELPPFKYPFALTHKNIYNGGWLRRINIQSLPVSKKMSGVFGRLGKGGVRELHWHAPSEWAFLIYGKLRITVVDPNGRAYVEEVGEGDVWFFPAGFAHSVQGIGEDGALFLAVFDDGNFGDDGNNPFNLLDWMNHVPKSVLAKNFLVPESVFDNMPPNDFHVFTAQLPGSLEKDKWETSMVTGTAPQSFAFFTNQMRPNVTRSGGIVRIIDANNFPASTMASAIVILKPTALRELHWHPNDDEWLYFVTGCARMGKFSHGNARTMDFQAGDVGYIEKSVAHYIENIGTEDVVFVEVFATPYFEDISLAEWLAHTPTLLVNEHLRTGEKFINHINKTKVMIQP